MAKVTIATPMTPIEQLVYDVGGREDVKDMIKAWHEATIQALEREGIFEDGGHYLPEEIEAKFRDLLEEASRIYAAALNWPERDARGYNPALIAILDEIEFKGDRYPGMDHGLRL
jgi:hypothetical protein